LIKYVLLIYALASAVTFVAYFIDKRRAVRGRGARRVPERTLHCMELLGGWPGALAGQSCFRHKRRKTSYMMVVFAVIALHAAAWGAWWMWR
jgi:uncharacterized membrane protein YsdA (DUF1294 family)